MFNSSYGGIESDGMMHGARPEQFMSSEQEGRDYTEASLFKHDKCEKTEKKGLFGSSLLKNFEIDDLILIGIALLLLMDGDGDNDIFVFVIAALVLLS